MQAREQNVILDSISEGVFTVNPDFRITSFNLYLIYALKGGSFRLDLTEADGSFEAKWLDPRTGKLQTADNGKIKAGRIVTFTAPNQNDWALWLAK